MPITTQNNVFTTSNTSEAASPLVAGVVSFTGLVPLFGTTGSDGTSEVEIGLMTVSSLNDWLARLNSRTVGISGPTGGWAGEWWSVYNYLQYGGICLVGGTGSTGDFYSANGVLGITNTPLHVRAMSPINVVFETGNTFSAGAAVDIATKRQDCLAIIGNSSRITTPLTTTYSNYSTDFGTTAASENVVYVAGRKKFVAGVGTTVFVREANLSPDIAGCYARTARDASLFNSPAGRTRGRILGVVSMQQTFSDTDAEYLISGNVNPVMVYPGEGTFLMGNVTSYSGSGALGHINNAMTVSYLRSQLLNIAQNLLFELNTPSTRQRFISTATSLLESMKSGNGISNYRVICDETNNTPAIVEQNKLIADVYIQPTFSAETVVINIINSNTSQAF